MGAAAREMLVAAAAKQWKVDPSTCRVEKGTVIQNSVIGVRCRIGKNVVIRNSSVMGADMYQPADEIAVSRTNGHPAIGVGEGSVIDGAILDKNCRIGRNVRIERGQSPGPDRDIPGVSIRDGIIVVQKDATLPDNWRLT
jgi:glucose-1-phosphate adenylyltransferase